MIGAAFIGLLAFVVLFLATLLLFAAICRFKQVRDAGRLTPTLRLAGQLFLCVGLLFDCALNVAMSVLFLYPPQDWLLTGRLIRYKRAGAGAGRLTRWRFWLASFICAQLLDPLDPSGCHCNTS